MSVSIDQVFVKQFEADVHLAYQQMGTKLRSTIRSKAGVVGSSTTFQKIGKGTAATKSRHGIVPVMNLNHEPVECILQDYYAGDWVDALDELKVNIDERRVVASAGAYALGRKTDELIITAMNNATVEVADYSTGLTKDLIMSSIEQLNTNDVPDDGRRFAVVGVHQWNELLSMDEFVSADYFMAWGTRSARIISFSVSENEKYILALSDGHITIYNNETMVQDLQTPWDKVDLIGLQYAQRFGTMIFVHPNYQPQILEKNIDSFELSDFEFSVNSDMTNNMPFMRFDDSKDVYITVSTSSYGNNFATFTINKNFWTSDNVGGRLFLLNKQWSVYEYVSPNVIIASTNGSYTTPSGSVSDWKESAFGVRRGWTYSISFHQDRLVFGGSRSHPSGIWMSKVGDHDNFNVGTGLDDESIFITLLSEQRQQICTIVSSDNLQILTSVGEWAISNKPLTPASVNTTYIYWQYFK